MASALVTFALVMGTGGVANASTASDLPSAKSIYSSEHLVAPHSVQSVNDSVKATLAVAASDSINGTVSSELRRYNTVRYKSRHRPVSFNGNLAKQYCEFRNWDNPALWNTDIVYLEYGDWSLGLRFASNNRQFTRLQFSGQHGSGVFPGTAGTAGDYGAYFKVNTKGSTCVMNFSGTLNY